MYLLYITYIIYTICIIHTHTHIFLLITSLPVVMYHLKNSGYFFFFFKSLLNLNPSPLFSDIGKLAFIHSFMFQMSYAKLSPPQGLWKHSYIYRKWSSLCFHIFQALGQQWFLWPILMRQISIIKSLKETKTSFPVRIYRSWNLVGSYVIICLTQDKK